MAIPAAEFARRRRTLMNLMGDNSIAVLPAAPVRVRSRDTEYLYRQDSDFHYLCGFPEPEAVLVLLPGREQGEFVLFCRERNREREIWDGYRQGPEGACEHYGADDAFPIGDIDDILPGLLEGRDRVYYSMGRHPEFDNQLMGWINHIRSQVKTGAVPPNEFSDLDHFLHDLRLYKSSAELKVMRRAGEISAAAHCRAMEVCKPGLYEYQLEAELHHQFAMAGARSPAYSSIVGGGANGCILHYIENRDRLKDGDLVLIDAGCELHGYAADITRTFPVNGSFSKQQRALYEIVLAAQQAAFEQVKPGNPWSAGHDAAVKVIVDGLLELGLLRGERAELIESGAHREFYMHKTGHWIGLDVHDVGDYRVDDHSRVLEPGMVLTVEPGIYIAPDNLNVEEKWRGIGIRIEDNLAVTADGYENLTVGVPKAPEEIEQLMAAG
ncbi:Xaa-Pro aminopeptidase [Porticoccus sp. W117]|uniref:Xaa-Pro aminopeptidase n=1 Tax=Porticoccus sp. W117 TaxID=3054777 RepID=UPI0025916812|nr:Xaa-Pro aminopeptidase [Porticoccus sp. W117]MDM3872032.1 Xaa-Pro aminopeptidase [Porticoccus sp. W117]